MKSAVYLFRSLAFRLPLSAFGLFLAGCSLPTPQADSVRYFTLTGPTANTPVPGGVSVRPVRMAGHLRNKDMAVRVSSHEVVYLEDVRWAEPLDEAITHILRQRLRQVPGDAAVSVNIQRCELVRNENNTVQLQASYSIIPATGDARSGEFTAPAREWDGKDYGALVSHLGDAVAELADAIAQAAEAK
jgi:uncharacterized lipoprotein YmbA